MRLGLSFVPLTTSLFYVSCVHELTHRRTSGTSFTVKVFMVLLKDRRRPTNKLWTTLHDSRRKRIFFDDKTCRRLNLFCVLILTKNVQVFGIELYETFYKSVTGGLFVFFLYKRCTNLFSFPCIETKSIYIEETTCLWLFRWVDTWSSGRYTIFTSIHDLQMGVEPSDGKVPGTLWSRRSHWTLWVDEV